MFHSLELSILGCDVSCQSQDDAMKVFAKVLPSLPLSMVPSFGNLPITEVEKYLGNHHFEYSVLLVDGNTVRDGSDNQRSKEIQRLVGLAVDKVGKFSNCADEVIS